MADASINEQTVGQNSALTWIIHLQRELLYSGTSNYNKVSQYFVTSKHFWWRQAGKEGLNANVPPFNLFSNEYLIASVELLYSRMADLRSRGGKRSLHRRSCLMEVQPAFIMIHAFVASSQLETDTEVTSRECYSKFLGLNTHTHTCALMSLWTVFKATGICSEWNSRLSVSGNLQRASAPAIKYGD